MNRKRNFILYHRSGLVHEFVCLHILYKISFYATCALTLCIPLYILLCHASPPYFCLFTLFLLQFSACLHCKNSLIVTPFEIHIYTYINMYMIQLRKVGDFQALMYSNAGKTFVALVLFTQHDVISAPFVLYINGVRKKHFLKHLLAKRIKREYI